MKLSLHLGLFLSICATLAYPQDFYRVPNLNALVVLKSRAEFNPNGVSNVTRLVVRDIPFLQGPNFEKVVEPYLWKPMTEQVMTNLQRDIVLFCRAHDRPLVDVLYPEQDVSNGNLQIIVLEGKLGEVKLQDMKGQAYTNGWTKSEWIRKNVRLQHADSILESRLMEDLDWLNRNPNFRRANVFYEPTKYYGTSDVVLRIEDRRPIRVFAGYEDTGSKITGNDRVLAGFEWGKAFGLTDNVLGYTYTTDTGFNLLKAHTATYAAPLPWRHTLRFYGSFVDVKGAVETNLNLKGTSYQASMRYEVPLPFLGKYQHEVSLGADYKSSDNNLEFNISTINTPTEIFQAVFGYSGALPDPWGQTSLGAQIYYSPGGLTEKNEDSFFSKSHAFSKADYLYGRVSAERMTRLPWQFSWILRGVGQLSDGNLLPSEQLGLGGYNTVRGYEEREANGDEGWFVSNELRTPPLSLGKMIGRPQIGDQLQFLGFWDYGVTGNKKLLPGEDANYVLSSVGGGLRYTITRYLTLRFDYGWQLADTGLQSPHNSRGHLGVQVSF